MFITEHSLVLFLFNRSRLSDTFSIQPLQDFLRISAGFKGFSCLALDRNVKFQHHHHHDHDADEVFTSWGKETIRKYTEEGIAQILAALENEETYGNVLRAKGMVPAEDGSWIYFDMVPGETDIRKGAPEYTGRFCVIGAELKEDALEKLFTV